MSFDQFIAQWNGKGLDHDNYYGFQCYDLAHKYAIDVVGHDVPSLAAAKDLWTQTIEGYDKIKNTPTAVPSKGDIVIWGTDVGPYGHVAVFVSGDENSFNSFDQNWPVGSVCHIQPHNYTGVLGWFHPKTLPAQDTITIDKKTFEDLVTKATKWDSFNAVGYTEAKQVTDKVSSLEARIKELEAANNSLSVSLRDEEFKLTQSEITRKSLEVMLNEVEKDNTSLAKENEKLSLLLSDCQKAKGLPEHSELDLFGIKIWILK